MEGEKRRYRSVHQEILEEILVKLPVKSLVRFKSVSKEWRQTIESTYFIEKHIRYQKSLETQQARLIVELSNEKRYNGLALGNLLVSANGIVSVDSYQPIRAFNRFDGFKISAPCDGLFCIYTITRVFTLVNPATTSRRKLPGHTPVYGGHMYSTLLGIGRENSASRRYKLLWFYDCDNKYMSNNESSKCKVFALDSNTWRDVDPPHCRVDYDNALIHLDGVMYCYSYNNENRHDVKVLAFDLHTETTQRFPITPDIGSIYSTELSMHILNHRICIYKSFVDDDIVFNIWGLDINNRSWERMYSIDLSFLPPEFYKPSFLRRSIIPVATINNYVIISNVKRTIWLLYGSKNSILYPTSFPFENVLSSYFETLISAYQ